MRPDYYATPDDLVAVMLSAAGGDNFQTILDPAAGDGRLVRAGEERWPRAQLIAVEVDSGRASALANSYERWRVLEADFLATDVMAPTPLDGPLLVLLNPPFSERGARAISVDWPPGLDTACGRAMAFVLRAAQLVEQAAGELVAIVPAGLLTNQRDALAREHLSSQGTLSIISETPGYAFQGAAANTAIVRWVPQGGLPSLRRSGEKAVSLREVRVVRGALPVHRAKEQRTAIDSPGRLPFLHTTSVSAAHGVLPELFIRPRACDIIISPPCLILQRVGQASVDKLVVYDGEPVVLSDCLYAVECCSVEAAGRLRDAVLDCWKRFRSRYGGSCAPFLRLDDLVAALSEHQGRPASELPSQQVATPPTVSGVA